LSLVGFSVSYDIVKGEKQDDRKQLSISRYVMFFTALASLILAYFQPPAIMWITYFAGTLFAASWGPVAFISIASRKITAPAAFTGMLVGFLINIATKLLDEFGFISLPVYLDPIVLGLFSNLACILVVSRFTTPSSKALAFLDEIRITPVEELDPVEVKKTLAWPIIVMISGVAIAAGLFLFYAVPFAQALGHTPGLLTGEGLLSLGYGAAVSAVGLLAFWQVKRVYGKKQRMSSGYEPA
jgi:sodium/pantothenate symporter